jgi:hypothetical protein
MPKSMQQILCADCIYMSLANPIYICMVLANPTHFAFEVGRNRAGMSVENRKKGSCRFTKQDSERE